MKSKYVETAISLPIHRTFTYEVPEALSNSVVLGTRVIIPFGRGRVTGYVIGEKDDAGGLETKPILEISDDRPLFPKSMIRLFKWIADYYIHPIGEVIQGALPSGLNVRDSVIASVTPEGLKALAGSTTDSVKIDCLARLKSGPLSLKTFIRETGNSATMSCIRSMEKKGWVTLQRELERPSTKPLTEKHVSLVRSDIPDDRYFAKRKRVIDALATEGEIPLKKLKELAPGCDSAIRFLSKNNYISISGKRVFRDPFGDSIEPDRPPPLTDEQRTAVSEITGRFEKGFSAFLLAGVTGSGKTEVYMRLAEEALKRGRKALVMVPEIALISQTERRFRSRFGECVAVLHSGLSSGERYDQWIRIAEGKATIVIGARSAVFAPLSGLGLIVVDEEHDTSYKQESRFKYNARDISVVRAKQEGCTVVLGSATPSVQSWYNVKTEKFRAALLEKRVADASLPDVEVIDLKESGNLAAKRFITPVLHEAIKETLERREQILIFLNRRGYANFPVCPSCGESVRCKNCDITLTLHLAANACKCHYCGFMRPAVLKCPACGSPGIRFLGFGTEKAETSLRSLFPDARIARMDRDTTRRKGSLVKILKDLKNKKTDILVGTQMVTKGHDFPGITLVGILCADLSLGFPDFRAGERTFQLIAQVSGRAGRGRSPGRVILQTFKPSHYSISAAKAQDFRAFYEKEIVFRKSLVYPPYSRLIQLKISGKDKEKTRRIAMKLGDLCKQIRSAPDFRKTIDILGPIEAPVSKIANRYRWQMLLKCVNVKQLHDFANRLIFENKSIFNTAGVKVGVDVDPFFMM